MVYQHPLSIWRIHNLRKHCPRSPLPGASLLVRDAYLILEECFETLNSLLDSCNSANFMRLPSYILDKKVGASCNLWASVCTVLEIHTG
jgi:hypothetical protein